MKKKILNTIQLKKFIQSFDLALFALEIFDPYSYNFFLQEIQKKNELVIIVFNFRLQNQIILSYKTNKQIKILKFLQKQIIYNDDLKEILLILSKTLNTKFCYNKLRLISFYFLPEYSFFLTSIKMKTLNKITRFNFWRNFSGKRLVFFFSRLFPRSTSSNYKVFHYISFLYLQEGLRFLNFYKSL